MAIDDIVNKLHPRLREYLLAQGINEEDLGNYSETSYTQFKRDIKRSYTALGGQRDTITEKMNQYVLLIEQIQDLMEDHNIIYYQNEEGSLGYLAIPKPKMGFNYEQKE